MWTEEAVRQREKLAEQAGNKRLTDGLETWSMELFTRNHYEDVMHVMLYVGRPYCSINSQKLT